MVMTTGKKFAAALVLGVIGLGAVLLAMNPAPRVPVMASGDVATANQPFVVKLHARWCPVCMVTKDVWSEVVEAYAGRVRLVVFDFTTDSATDASRNEARRLGLDAVFEQYVGETGTVLVVDGVSKNVTRVLHGTRDLAAYRAAIDPVIAATHD